MQEKSAFDREMRQREQDYRQHSAEDDFAKDFFNSPTPFDQMNQHKYDSDMIGVEHSYDWKSKTFNHRTDTDMSSNKRYEIQAFDAKAPTSAAPISDSIAQQYIKNEESIMKDIRDIQKKQAAQAVEEQEHAAEY